MRSYQSYKNSDIAFHHVFLTSIIYVLQHHIKGLWLENIRKKIVRSIISSLQKKRAQEGLKAGTSIQIEKRINLTEQEFVKNYLRPGVPVIFDQGAALWKCTTNWNIDFLERRYGNESFNVLETAGLYENHEVENISEGPKSKQIKIKDFVQGIKDGSGEDYLRFCPLIEADKSLLEDLDSNWLNKMRKCFMGVSYQTFIGPAKKRTPIHSETLAFFYVMVDGEKNWTLFPTSAFPLFNPLPEGKGYHFSKIDFQQINPETHPGVELLHRFTCHLKKGDILFVPAWMWHEVENITTSWGLSCQFTNIYGLLKQPTFTFVRMFLTKPSFFSVLYYSFFRSDITKRSKYLLTPKIRFKG